MSGAPILRQRTISLMFLTILPTMTQTRLSNEVHIDVILHVRDNDKCELAFHEPESLTECQDALRRFSLLKKQDKSQCPNARDAACRDIRGTKKCTFVCDPTDDEIAAAMKDGNHAEPTTKSLNMVMSSLSRYTHETEEEKQRRRERQQQRKAEQKERMRHKYRRSKKLLEDRRQSQQPLQQNQLQQQQFPFNRREVARVNRRIRSEILNERRSRRPRLH